MLIVYSCKLIEVSADQGNQYQRRTRSEEMVEYVILTICGTVHQSSLLRSVAHIFQSLSSLHGLESDYKLWLKNSQY